jgi:hypothetical protein
MRSYITVLHALRHVTLLLIYTENGIMCITIHQVDSISHSVTAAAMGMVMGEDMADTMGAAVGIHSALAGLASGDRYPLHMFSKLKQGL